MNRERRCTGSCVEVKVKKRGDVEIERTYGDGGIKHGFCPRLAFAARAANDFCAAELVLARLRALVRDCGSAVHFVERKLLDELRGRVRRGLVMLGEVLAEAFVV